jgi:hypothetical protein
MKNKLLFFAAIGFCFISISSVGAQKLRKAIQLKQTAGRPEQVKWVESDRIDLMRGQGAGAIRLLYDQAHSELTPPSQMDTIAKKLGLEIQLSAQPINAESIKGARILYLRAPSKEFSSTETVAIVAFVKCEFRAALDSTPAAASRAAYAARKES